MARSQRQAKGSGDTNAWRIWEEQPEGDDEDQILQWQYQRCVFQWAAARVQVEFQETTWQAFWRTYVDNRGSQEVANELGISLEAVYKARSRVMARLRKQVQQVDEAQGSLPPTSSAQ